MSASSLPHRPSDCDVVVLGGGPAGAAAAITLARAGCSVTIIERSRYEEARIGETLPPSARPLLAGLGVWEEFVSAGHLPAPGVVSAWGEDEPFESHFIFNANGHGWHLDRQRFDAMLARAAHSAGARLYRGARLRSCLPLARGWQIEFTSGASGDCRLHRIEARLVVDATGRAAAVARQQGAKRLIVDRLMGLAGVVAPRARGHECPTAAHKDCGGDPWTVVEARTDGWWYSALLPTGRWIAIYMTDADLLQRARGSWRAFWQARLQETTHTRARLETLDLDAAPRAIAANSSRLDRVSGDRWFAIGDAAIAHDPLSGRGLVHALASGVRAGEAAIRRLDGAAAAPGEYAAQSNDLFRDYLKLRAKHYDREQRWSQSVFWRRRHLQLPERSDHG